MEPFLGQIQPFGFNFPPRGWALCAGQLLQISSNTALFSLLGTTFGGDGRTTFGLPDLRGRSLVGEGSGPGLDSISWGERGGAFSKILATNNMPSHNHVAQFHLGAGLGNTAAAKDNKLAANSGGDTIYTTAALSTTDSLAGGTVTTNNVGGSQAFNIRNPFLGVYVCIALQGIYPSRN